MLAGVLVSGYLLAQVGEWVSVSSVLAGVLVSGYLLDQCWLVCW